MWVLTLGLEDLLEEGVATHFSILAWRISSTEEPVGLQYMGLQKSDMTDGLTLLLTCTQGCGGWVGQWVVVYLFKSSA